MSDSTFQDLIARVRAGDATAAQALVRDYEPVLRRIIRVRLVDPALRRVIAPSDIFQSVMGTFFVRVALGQFDLQRPEDLVKLLAVMAKNRITDKLRKKDVERTGPTPPLRLDEMSEDVLAASMPNLSQLLALQQLAARARAQLPPDVLAIIRGRDDGLAWDELAARMGIAADALRKRLARAVAVVAATLEEPR